MLVLQILLLKFENRSTHRVQFYHTKWSAGEKFLPPTGKDWPFQLAEGGRYRDGYLTDVIIDVSGSVYVQFVLADSTYRAVSC